jgi:hypothetical protein
MYSGLQVSIGANAAPKEIVPQGTVTTTTDYLLFKFGEHKSAIEGQRAQWNVGRPTRLKTFTEMEDMIGSLGGGETYGTFRNVTDTQNDYVTVRNRHRAFGGPVIRLSSLIALIEAKHTYREIKCAFCRETKLAGFVPDLRADIADSEEESEAEES